MKSVTRLVAVASAVLAVVAAAQDKVELNTITKVLVSGGSISIQGTKKPNFTTFTMTDPARLVIDISEAVFSGVADEQQVGNGIVTAIKTASYGSDASAIARVLIGFEKEYETDIQTSDTKLVVKVLGAGGGGTEVAQADKAPAGGTTTGQAAADKAAADKAAADKAAKEQATADKAAAEQKAKDEALAKKEAERQAKEQAEADKKAAAEQKKQEAEAARQAAAEEKKKQAEEAAAEREQKKQEALAAKQASAEEKQKAAEEAAAEREQKKQEALAAKQAAAEEKKRLAEEAAAERERKRQEAAEAKQQQKVAMAETSAPPPRGEVESSSSLSVSSRRKNLTFVGFKQDPGTQRVYVRTNEPVRYSLSKGGDKEVVLELENTSIALHNNERFLDTSYFNGAVAMVQPRVGPTRTVRVEIHLKENVPYEAKQEGNEVYVDFQSGGGR